MNRYLNKIAEMVTKEQAEQVAGEKSHKAARNASLLGGAAILSMIPSSRNGMTSLGHFSPKVRL